MEPMLQGLGAAPQPMMGTAPQPNMQAQGAMGQPAARPAQSQMTPQMLMMIRQHVMRQALMANAIAKAKQAGLRDAQRKMARDNGPDGKNPNDVLGEALPNDPAFGAGASGSGGNYQFSNNPGR